MDIISHGLYGGIALGRKKRKDYIFAFILSIVPDIFAEGIMFILIFIGVKGMPSLEHGHPNITELPVYAQNFYNTTHSLIIFILVFIFIWIVRKRPYWILLVWGIHVIIDIPTHSYDLFPTPFLWPISNFKINGISWDRPIVMIINISILLIVYAIWILKSKRLKYFKINN